MNLTIITVVYNDLEGLKRTESSVVSQSIVDRVEWVIIDGHSDDGTRQHCLKLFELGVAIGVSQADNGIYDAMNKGIALSTGDYVLFLNAGDMLRHNQVLLETEFHVDKAENGSMFLLNYYLLYSESKQFERNWSKHKRWYTMPTSHQAIIFPRVVSDVIRYDTDYRIKGDYYLYRYLQRKEVPEVYVNIAISTFSHGGISSQNLRLSILEHWRVERNVRHAGLLLACTASVRCLVSTLGRYFLSFVV